MSLCAFICIYWYPNTLHFWKATPCFIYAYWLWPNCLIVPLFLNDILNKSSFFFYLPMIITSSLAKFFSLGDIQKWWPIVFYASVNLNNCFKSVPTIGETPSWRCEGVNWNKAWIVNENEASSPSWQTVATYYIVSICETGNAWIFNDEPKIKWKKSLNIL